MRSPRRREGTYRMQLNASTRQIAGKRSRQLHREGKLAAVVYGHAAAATPIVLDRLEFQKVFVKIVHKRELKIEEEVAVADGEVPAEGEGEAAEGVPAEGEQAETEE